jgi:ubiquitin-conjugating enzyme E2 Z
MSSNSPAPNSKQVTKTAMKRIFSDVKSIIEHPLEDHGIYYKHDDENMLRGYCLFIPTEKSPYQYGNYLFTIEFPENYPYSPPVMKFFTNNGHTRFHPNFYKNGKVCLDILNSWRGEEWTSCNTLSSVLINISPLFNTQALLNEPGISMLNNKQMVEDYDVCITYQNFKTAINDVVAASKATTAKQKGLYGGLAFIFKDIIQREYEKNKEVIKESLKINAKSNVNRLIELNIYKMREDIDYLELLK